MSNSSNAVTPLCWRFYQDTLTISSVSEMYPTAVIWIFWACDFCCVARRCRVPYHISKMLWTLAIPCNLSCSVSLLISKLLSVFVVPNAVSTPPNNTLLAWANCLTLAFLRRVSPVVFVCLLPITSHPRENLGSTPTQFYMIEIMSCATLERSADFECIFSCWCHQSVISGIQYVLLLCVGSEW